MTAYKKPNRIGIVIDTENVTSDNQTKKLSIQISSELHKKIKLYSVQTNRTITEEIVPLLEEYYKNK